jgi:pimeloyl-ACP methyl ester carboxylesterase
MFQQLFLRYHIVQFILCLVILFMLNACLGRYIYTDKEIAAHYANQPVKPTFKYFSFKGKQLFYAASGNPDKPLLVLIHGSPGAWYGYMNLLDDSVLQAHFYMVAMDRLGYFKSRNKRSFVSINEQAESIDSLIQALNVKQQAYFLFGRSYGAPIASVIASNRNEQVKHLYLISPAMDPKTEKFFWFSRLGKWWIVRIFLPKALNTATDEKYAHAAELIKTQAVLPSVTCSTTVMTGTADWIVDTTNFDYCKRELIRAKARFIKLNGVGHLITYERPDLIKSMLLDDAK